MRRSLVVLVLGVLVSALPAAAAVVDRVRIHDTGGNRMEVFTRSVFMVFRSPADYRRGCCYDTNGGEWRGPRYIAPGGSGDATIDWSYVPEFGRASSAAAAASQLDLQGSDVATGNVPVPHAVGGRAAGAITAAYVLRRGSNLSGNARYAGVLAFPLYRGIHAVAEFELLAPSADPAVVNGVLASAWNQQQADAALRGVSLVGSLPPTRVVARARGRRIVGVVRDINGHPVAGAAVGLGRPGRVRSGASGAFVLRVRARGTYRVVAKLIVSARSAPVRVR